MRKEIYYDMLSKSIDFVRDIIPPFLWRFILKLKRLILNGRKREGQKKTSHEKIENVFHFFSEFQDFRTDERCSVELGIEITEVKLIKKQLYKDRRLGTYSLGLEGPPHALIRERISTRFGITKKTLILEIGPGANPLFPKTDYFNAISVDKYGTNGQMLLYGNMMNMVSISDFRGSYSTFNLIPEVQDILRKKGGFELIAGCHSFEHETRPITGLRNIYSSLRTGGRIILFVPDGWSDDLVCRDSTHTMYLTPDMIKEFFDEVSGFEDLIIESFRPNFDIMISAIKKD